MWSTNKTSITALLTLKRHLPDFDVMASGMLCEASTSMRAWHTPLMYHMQITAVLCSSTTRSGSPQDYSGSPPRMYTVTCTIQHLPREVHDRHPTGPPYLHLNGWEAHLKPEIC